MLDEFRETAITWDKANRKVYEPLRVSAGDNKGRKLSVQVVNGGVIESLSGASLSLFWETKDKAYKGLDAFTVVDAAKGEFEIYYTTGMLSNEGTLNANLVLVDASGRIVSEPFTITVFKGIDDDAIQSSDSFTALTEALVQVGTINNKADRDELLALESTFEQNKVSVEQQLHDKATHDELQSALAAVADGGPTIIRNTFNSLVTDYPNGATGTALVLETDPAHIYVWFNEQWTDAGPYQGVSLKDNTVSPEKTTFIDKSTNLINIRNLQQGTIDAATGGLIDATTWNRVPTFERITPNTAHTLAVGATGGGQMRAFFYDENMNYLSYVQTTDTIRTVTTGANIPFHFVRYAMQRSVDVNAVQFNKGATKSPYEPYYVRLSELIELPGMTYENAEWRV